MGGFMRAFLAKRLITLIATRPTRHTLRRFSLAG
jgi:hypothetical protein